MIAPVGLGIDYTPALLQIHQRPVWQPFAAGQDVFLLCGRKWGKTGFLAIACANAAPILGSLREQTHILFASYAYDNLESAFSMVVAFLKTAGVSHHATRSGSPKIRVGNCLIHFASMQNADTRVSETFRIIFFDEAALIKDIVAHRILPTQLRHQVVRPQFIGATTPRGPNWAKVRWDAAIDARFQRSSYDCPYNWPADIQAIEKQMPRRVAEAEIYARWLAGDGRVFNAEEMQWWSGRDEDLASDEWVQAIGCDLASREDFTVLFRITNKRRLMQPKRFARREWPTIIETIKGWCSTWPDATVCVDGTGLGGVVVGYLRPHIPKLWPVIFTNETKSAMISAVEVGIDQHQLWFPEDPTVRAEFAAFDYEKLPSGLYKYGAPEGQHDDTVTAAILAHWCALRHHVKVVGNLPRE